MMLAFIAHPDSPQGEGRVWEVAATRVRHGWPLRLFTMKIDGEQERSVPAASMPDKRLRLTS